MRTCSWSFWNYSDTQLMHVLKLSIERKILSTVIAFRFWRRPQLTTLWIFPFWNRYLIARRRHRCRPIERSCRRGFRPRSAWACPSRRWHSHQVEATCSHEGPLQGRLDCWAAQLKGVFFISEADIFIESIFWEQMLTFICFLHAGSYLSRTLLTYHSAWPCLFFACS